MSFNNQKDGLGTINSNILLKKGLVEAFGKVPVNDQSTSLYIRATVDSDEAERIAVNGYGFEKLGFAGNGAPLGLEEQANLEVIDKTHRGFEVVEFFAFPNIRRDVINILQAAGLNHRDVPMETLFTEPYKPNQYQKVGQSGMMINTDEGLLIPNIFFKGYFDKTDNSWHPNPAYWETTLEPQAREDMRKIIIAKAMVRLHEIIDQRNADIEFITLPPDNSEQ